VSREQRFREIERKRKVRQSAPALSQHSHPRRKATGDSRQRQLTESRPMSFISQVYRHICQFYGGNRTKGSTALPLCQFATLPHCNNYESFSRMTSATRSEQSAVGYGNGYDDGEEMRPEADTGVA